MNFRRRDREIVQAIAGILVTAATFWLFAVMFLMFN